MKQDDNIFTINRTFEEQKREFFDRFYKEHGWRTHRYEDERTQSKYDLALVKNGKRYFIEEKFRRKDYGDLIVEIVQYPHEPYFNLGWIYSCEADYIFYALGDTYDEMKIYSINTKKLKEYINNNNKNMNLITTPRGSINWVIDWLELAYSDAVKVIKHPTK